MGKIYSFNGGRNCFYAQKLSIGDMLEVHYGYYRSKKVRPNCMFVKVTRKGFNILDLDTNRMILSRHLYDRKMSGKEYPQSGPIKVTCLIPEYVKLKIKQDTKEQAS